MKELDEVKNLLTDTELLNKFHITQLWEKTDDLPSTLWEISHYTYRMPLNDIKRISDNDWIYQTKFKTKTIEEAVSYCIIKEFNYDYSPKELCDIPEKLKKFWSKHEFIIYESMSSKVKWNETRINKRATLDVYETIKETRIKTNNDMSSKLNYLLSKVPDILINMAELTPVGFSLSEILERNPCEKYPYFLYKGYIFKSEYYIADQRAICGYNENFYEEDDIADSIKVEISSVDLFIEKDVVYLRNWFLYYNDTITKIDKKLEKLDIKKLYPEAIRYDGNYESYGL